METYRNTVHVQPGITLLCSPDIATELVSVLSTQPQMSDDLKSLLFSLRAQLPSNSLKEVDTLAS